MSERVLTGFPVGSPENSVTTSSGMAEVRWILPGQLDDAIAGWFGRFPGGMDSREDAYLVHPALRGLSVKIRAGRALEVKVCHGSPGILDTAGRARGRIESWQKWSFPVGLLDSDEVGPTCWTVVHKRRRHTRFQMVSGRLTADVSEQVAGPAVAVDLTEVRSGSETWWTLGFEATGPADLLCGSLRGTAELVFAEPPPGDAELGMSHSRSYAEWLARR